jgi:tetrahydromethanopterin S-methyltransferase subunit F
MYLFIFSIDPISIESVVPEGVAFVIHPVITLTIWAVHPMRAILALRGGRNRWLASGVTSAAFCKLMVGILVMGFATPGACGCLFRAVFVGMSPLPAFPAKQSPY